MAMGEFKNAPDGIFARQDLDMGVGGAGSRQVLVNGLLIGGVEAVLLDVNRIEVAMKQVRLAAAAADHHRRIRARRKAHQNTLLRAVNLFDTLALEISFQLVVDYVGRQHQRYLAQLREMMLLPAEGCFIRTVVSWSAVL